MAVTKEELQSFHDFACKQVERGNHDLSIDELLMQWLDTRERADINAVIRQGLDDIDAGGGRPARAVMDELRQKYHPPRQ